MPDDPTPTWRARLYRPDGSRRPDAELLAEGGHIGLRLALLDEATHQRARSGEADLLYPPRLFLSYKWGSAAQNAWVATLAQQLVDQGWDVVFDRWRDELADRTVEAFVSRLASCQVFVAVLSQDYLAATVDPRRPTWVFDETQCAMMMRDQLRLIGIVPPPPLAAALPAAPRAAVAMPPRADRLAIVLQQHLPLQLEELYTLATDADLPPLLASQLHGAGPALDAETRAWAAARLTPDADEATLHEVLARLPFIAGAWRRLVAMQRDQPDLPAALASTEQALAALASPVARLPFERERIELRKRLGDRTGAARAATDLLSTRPHDWVAHWHLGDLLDDAQAWWAARAHLLLAQRNLPPHTSSDPALTLAVVYMALGLLTPARHTLQAVLAQEPDNARAQRNLARVMAALGDDRDHDHDDDQQGSGAGGAAQWTTIQGPLPGCSDCRALFIPTPGQPVFCAACAAPRATDDSACPVCGADGWAPVPEPDAPATLAVRCPVCRTGHIRWLPQAVL